MSQLFGSESSADQTEIKLHSCKYSIKVVFPGRSLRAEPGLEMGGHLTQLVGLRETKMHVQTDRHRCTVTVKQEICNSKV